MFAGRRYRGQIDKLIQQWTDYRAAVLGRLGTDDLGPEEERRFLELKGKLAEKVAGLAEKYGFGASQEVQAHQRGMGDFLNKYTTLHADEPLNEREREAFEREWHRHYLFLNKLKGMKPKPRPQRPAVEFRPASLGPPPSMGGPVVSAGPWFASLVLRLGALAVAVWAAIRFIPWNDLETMNASEIGGGDASSALSQGMGTVKGWFAGLTSGASLNFYQPVVEKYGPEVTAILVGVLLLTLGYWLFIRTR